MPSYMPAMLPESKACCKHFSVSAAGFLLRFLKGGKKFPIAGTWYMVHGTWYMVHGPGVEPEVSVFFDERKCSNH